MAQRERILTIGVIAFLLWGIIATSTTSYYYQQYIDANQRRDEYYQKYITIRGSVIQISVTLNYGNSTSVTKTIFLSPNTTVLDALKATATVNATYWSAYQSLLIDAINSVANNANGNNMWWEYWVNDELALVGVDQYKLRDGDSVEWKYSKY